MGTEKKTAADLLEAVELEFSQLPAMVKRPAEGLFLALIGLCRGLSGEVQALRGEVAKLKRDLLPVMDAVAGEVGGDVDGDAVSVLRGEVFDGDAVSIFCDER